MRSASYIKESIRASPAWTRGGAQVIASLGKLFTGIALTINAPNGMAFVSSSSRVVGPAGHPLTLGRYAEQIGGATGTPVLFSNGRIPSCRPKASSVLLGFYSPSSHAIVICNENHYSPKKVLETLVHEFTHAVQYCLGSNLASSPQAAAAVDIASIKRLYPRSQWDTEIEARAVAYIVTREISQLASFVPFADKACARVKSTKGRSHWRNGWRPSHYQ